MRSSTRLAGIALMLLAGCADSCGCGAKKTQPTQEPGAAKAPAPAAAGGAAQPQDATPVQHAAWQPASDSALTHKLRAAQTAIDQGQKFDKLAAEKDLRSPLAAKVGTFAAAGDASSSTHNDAEAPLAVAARNYRDGKSAARVRITDTGLLPSARHAVSDHLTLVGNAAAGNEHGIFVRGYPAILGYYEGPNTSRLIALLGNRYLLQIMVEGSPQADAAQHVLEQLDWSALAPKQVKEPNPAR